MSGAIHRIREIFNSLFSDGNDRKRPADRDNFYYPSAKFRRVGYDNEDEYSDTDMDDLFGSKNKRKSFSSNKRYTSGIPFTNGYGHSSSDRTTNNDLPNDDVVFVSDQPPSTTPIFVTRVKPFKINDPIAHSSLRMDRVPPLMPLPKTSNNTSTASGPFRTNSTLASTSRLNFGQNNTKPPVPKAVPISLFSHANGMFSSTMQKQNMGLGFKGIDTVERLSRGQQMTSMARSRSPTGAMGTSIFSFNREKDEKLEYIKLLKQVCPDIYSHSKLNNTTFVDLTKDETKINRTNNVDLTSDEDKDSSKRARSIPPTEQVNTLLERLSVKAAFDPNLSLKYKTRAEEAAKERQIKIQKEEEILKERRNETDEVQRNFRKRVQSVPMIYDEIIQRIHDGEEEEEEEEESQYPELTAEHHKTIKYALYGGSASEVIINKFNLRITRNDLNTLVGTTWLNDEVINFYMNLIMERAEKRTDLPKSYCFNTFFIPTLMQRGHSGVRRWTRKVDVFSFDLLPVPVHVGGIHWCMAIIRMKDKIIRYYDSMGNPNQPVLDALERYLIDEAMDKKKITFDTSDWKKESIRDCPQQRNGSDCGVFSCMNAEHLTRNASLSFSQNDMPYFRQKMVLEIATGNLIT
uniref:CSON013837 protein n=1 Tax=Culicoides sonorensis TaxID=179676 RepID=A0A336K222_CULSO